MDVCKQKKIRLLQKHERNSPKSYFQGGAVLTLQGGGKGQKMKNLEDHKCECLPKKQIRPRTPSPSYPQSDTSPFVNLTPEVSAHMAPMNMKFYILVIFGLYF